MVLPNARRMGLSFGFPVLAAVICLEGTVGLDFRREVLGLTAAVEHRLTLLCFGPKNSPNGGRQTSVRGFLGQLFTAGLGQGIKASAAIVCRRSHFALIHPLSSKRRKAG